MATVNKDFRIKAGLVVEGANATVNGEDIITTGNTTDDITEGSTNLYFTAERAASAVADEISTAVSTAINALDTDAVEEGTTNLYFTNQRALNATASAYDAAGAASTAQTAAENYADGVATTAYNNAVSYADGLAVNYDPAGSADAAEGAANTYADGVALTAENNAKGYADTVALTAEQSAKSYADSLATNYDAAGAASTAEANANIYTDTAVANLVDGAPALLDTLNELAAAIADNPNYATDVANLVAGKQDIVTGVSDTEIGYLANVTSDIQQQLDDKLTSNSGIGSLSDVSNMASMIAGNGDVLTWDGANGWTASGVASQVTLPTNTSIGNVSSTEIGYLNGVTSNVQDQIDDKASTTYVDTNFVNVADLPGQLDDYIPLTDKGANDGVATLDSTGNVPLSQLGNVPDALITSVGTNLDVTAGELTVSATPTFTSVDINSVAKQVAATQSVASASTVSGLTWAKADYKSAKLVVKAKTGTHSQVSEIIVTLDSSDNVAITEFGAVYTDVELATVSADVSGTDVRIRVTTLGSSTDVTVVGTLLV
jgi:hypothetical protein